METLLLVILAIIILLAIAAFKLVSGLVKAALFSLAAALVVLAVVAGFAAKSALDFREGFESGTGLLLLATDDMAGLTGGFVVRLQDAQPNGTGEAVKSLSVSEIENMGLRFASRDYASLLGNSSWLVAVRGNSVTPPITDFVAKLHNNPLFVLSQYREGNIVVYPDLPAIKAVRLIPGPLLGKLGERLK